MKMNLLLVCLMSGAALAIAQDNTSQPSQGGDQGTMQQGTTPSGSQTGTGTDQGGTYGTPSTRQDNAGTDNAGATSGSEQSSKYARKAKGVAMHNGRMMFVLPNGETQPLDRESKINGMKANPDGTVTMKDGNTVTLREGDSVMKDGVMGVMMRDGKVSVQSVGGETRDMSKREITLMDGSKVTRDGRVTMKDGTTMTLSNGDMISADGTLKRGAGTGMEQRGGQGQGQGQQGTTPGTTR